MTAPLRLAALLLALVAVSRAAPPAGFALGANFNENLAAATVPLLDAGRVGWIRGFLPATEFVGGPRRLATDPHLATFRAAARSGRRVALTLKWDFKSTGTAVPAPDSPREAAYFRWALDVVAEGRPELLCLVNELFIDTAEPDLTPGPDGAIPMVRFLRRLAAHLAAARLTASDGRTPLPLSCGGFTRLDLARNQTHPATVALLPWLAAGPELAAVNFHLHNADFADFAAALAFLRQKIPARPIVVTEFSLVWRYRQNLAERLDRTDAGRAFAERHTLDPATTVVAYLNACLAHPVPEAQFHDFLRSRAWFDPAFLEKACALFRAQGVTLATYAYSQAASGGTRPLPADGTPWRLNPVFIQLLAVSPDPARPAANLGFYETFLRAQNPVATP